MIPPFSSLEFGIAVAMFAVVTVLGFVAARWNRPEMTDLLLNYY